ncbi:MAG: YbaK/EbsC family protein [Ignavibacteriales bacterium]|nr:YbaK/EbsC family protein [Ignavibacteriales bacterium]
MAKTSDLINYLQKSGMPFEVIDHELTFTAHQTAVATHVPDSELAKAIIVRVDGKFWMTVSRADMRVNESMVKRVLSGKNVHLAHEEDLMTLFPDCQLGAMPPFGNLYGLPVIVDDALTQDETVVFNACSHSKAIRMLFKDFKQLVHPLIAEIAEPRAIEERFNV